MLHAIRNNFLSVAVSEKGAELYSLKGKDGMEYLWQGDPKYWIDRSPNLFPFVGRLWNGSYTLNGTTYPLGLHGFARSSDFTLEEADGTHLVFLLKSSDETRAQYPFDFTLRIAYRLDRDRLDITYRVENESDTLMPFALGGHPGFRVPFDEGETFEEYHLAFSQPCRPDRVIFTPGALLSGQTAPIRLREDRVFPLKHDLFDNDAVVFKNMARAVTLSSECSKRSITVAYPDMPYVGFWHACKTDAPYVCIEPWSSLPGRQDVQEDFGCISDLLRLPPRETYHTTVSITVSEE